MWCKESTVNWFNGLERGRMQLEWWLSRNVIGLLLPLRVRRFITARMNDKWANKIRPTLSLRTTQRVSVQDLNTHPLSMLKMKQSEL